MPSNRFFAPVPFIKNETVLLEKEESRHLASVMRTKIGEQVELVNGKGEIAIAAFLSVKKEQAELLIESVQSISEEGPKIILSQAIPKLNRLEYIIEKGTELGASAFWLFPSLHSEKEDFSPNQQKRLELLAISALKQCGRLFLPPLLLKPPISSWETPQGSLFYGDTKEGAPWLSDVLGKETKEPIILFIGPEKGFHPKEVAALEKIGATGVKLHQNILRVDTASIAALSQLSLLLKQANY